MEPTNPPQPSVQPTPTPPSNTPQPPQKQSYIYVALQIFIVCIFFSLIGVLSYKYYLLSSANKQAARTEDTSLPTPIASSKPSPTPIILHAGKATYAVSHPKSLGPTIQSVTFDPVDSKKGELLHISTILSNDIPSTSVTGKLLTDNQSIELVFTQSVSKNLWTQVWTTELTLPDSVWYHYILSITAENAQGKTTVKVAPRS